MDFDTFLVSVLGEWGRAQKIIFILIGIVQSLFAIYTVSIVFLMANPDYWCRVPSADHLNLTLGVFKNLTHAIEVIHGNEVYKTCEIYKRNYSSWGIDDVENWLSSKELYDLNTTKCTDGFVYDTSVYKSSIVTDWDLTCDEGAWMQATASSVFMAGLMVGVLVFGNISDSFGRKPVFSVTLLMVVGLGFATAYAQSYLVFITLRFFLAIALLPCVTTGFVLNFEIIGPSYRGITAMASSVFWTIGYLTVGVVAYFVREWHKLQIILSIPVAIALIALFFVPESPRWLFSTNQHEKGYNVLHKLAKWNKVDIPDDIKIIQSKSSDDHVHKAYIWDLFRKRQLRIRTLIICFNWFVNSTVYYGLSLNTSNLGGDPYVNFFIGALVEIPAYIFCVATIDRLGRRLVVSSVMVFAGVMLVLTLVVPAHLNWISITLAMLGKMAIAVSFVIAYVFTAELFPTSIRNVAVASGSFSARIGGIMAPYIAQLSMYSKVIPLVIFGSLSIAAGFMVLILPETLGTKLPDTLEDGAKFGRKMKRPVEETEVTKQQQQNLLN